MKRTYSLSLHVFRRDLRLQDNTALLQALTASSTVIPCFIFDPRQIEKNDYKSEHCIQFMVQSLRELDEALREKGSQLYFFYGVAEEVIAKLINTHPIEAVFINRDYTPFSRKRDHAIQRACEKQQIDFHCYADALLHEPEEALKQNQQPYTIYTPFFRNAAQLSVRKTQKNSHDNYYQKPLAMEDHHQTLDRLARKQQTNLFVLGGRREGLKLLKQIHDLANYRLERDVPALNKTSKLSAHNKFGTISIREFHAAILHFFDHSHTLMNELYWRDFFTHIGFHFPHVFSEAFHQKYNAIAWSNNMTHFRAWCEGRTGFPIVDAGMRELNTTGYMHNRVRMITASFLVKDLHLDWHLGEKYFAQKLVDYDPAVNNGNWQWAASTGCDAQPYFRIFNPWLQQQKFDPDCLYIKRHVVELSHVDPRTIHQLYKHPTRAFANYPTPVVDHSTASQTAKLMYQTVGQKP